jgi:Ion channel
MVTRSSQGATKRQRRHVYSMALALAAGVFFFHTSVLYEVADHLIAAHAWLTGNYSPATAGKAIILVSFFILFITHFVEAAAWGLFLWRKGLIPTFTDGVYFSATTITALGYGDVVLPPPWRILGPLVAISGILMFGCSTAFLFLLLQKVWVLEL